MADRPIIFLTPLVRALLDGRKTQTRRVLKPQFPDWVTSAGFSIFTPPGSVSGRGRYTDEDGVDYGPAEKFIKLPYAAGDRLWVQEEWYNLPPVYPGYEPTLCRRASYPEFNEPGSHTRIIDWRNAEDMPRWASRLTLTVTNVRVHRVQDISEDDALAEGVKATHAGGPWGQEGLIEEFSDLWDSIHTAPEKQWDANPWVVALTFTVAERNIGER